MEGGVNDGLCGSVRWWLYQSAQVQATLFGEDVFTALRDITVVMTRMSKP